MTATLSILSVLTCLVACVLVPGSPIVPARLGGLIAAAAPGVAASSPWAVAYPGLATAPAPQWVRQGTRLTYYSAAALVPGGHEYVEDENGQWISLTTGKSYRQEELGHASGHGYTEVNVAWLDGSAAALELRSYTISGLNGPPTILTFGAAVGLPGAGDDFWLSPQVLAGIPESRAPELKVLRGPYSIGGTRYNAIRFQSGGQHWVFDLASGVLLHSGAAGTGAPIRGPVARGETTEGSSYLSQNTLVGVRTTALPWSSAPAPDWVARTRLLRYDGAINVYVPGIQPVPIPISATFRWQGGGPNWGLYQQTLVQAPGTPVPITTEAERVFGPAIVGGLWISPQALRQLRTGQVVDQDPVTQVTVSVGQTGRTPEGRTTIAITETGAGQSLEYLYDLDTGALLAVNNFDKVVNLQIQLRLVSSQ